MSHALGDSSCPAPKCTTGPQRATPTTWHTRSPKLCRRCRADLAATLTELPRLHREIGYLLEPATTPRGERVSGTRRLGIVFDEEASAVRALMTGVLASWAGTLTRLLPGPAPERAVGPLAMFLLRHLDLLVVHPAAAELAEEMRALITRARRVVQRHPAGHVTLGPCPRTGCGSTVEASVADADVGAGTDGAPTGDVRCGAGHTWPARQWLALRHTLTRDAPETAPARRTLPTRLAAQAVGVSEATVRKWASRGKLTRYGSHSRAEYDVEELAALATG